MTADAVGGVWQYTVDLVRRLAEGGAEVLVAVLGPAASDEQRNEIRSLPGVGLAEGNFALEWEPNSWTDVDASGDWLLQLDSQCKADIVHLNGYSHAALPWRKPVAVVAHSCVYSWWRNVLNSAPGPEWDEYKRRVTAGLLACEAIVAPSGFIAAEIGREYGVSVEKIRVIHNFSARQPAVAEEKQRFFFAAGRVWDPAKNFALLEQVAPHLSWPLRLAGRQNGEAAIRGSASGLEKLGHIPSAELLELMAKASVFVHPALYEPFGLAVLDAARTRCCLVLADTPSMRELWADAAIFLDPRDSNAWIQELSALSRDVSRCKDFGDRAFAHAERYKAESTVRAYQRLYAELMTRRRKRAEEAA
ncbi:MAG: glycosyltransferase [Bryobacteraceae bacterium]